MEIKINGVAIAAYPEEFKVTVLDFDNAETTVRSSDGTLDRDRIAIKRQLEMKFGLLTWAQISALLTQLSPVFFDVTYPDPMTGAAATKNMYVGNRPSPVGYSKDGVVYWAGLALTLTER